MQDFGTGRRIRDREAYLIAILGRDPRLRKGDDRLQSGRIGPNQHEDIAARGRIRARIDEARRLGYAAVEDELAYGVVAVAVPVLDAAGRVVAALNSSSHSKKISRVELARERVGMLQEISAALSSELGRFPGLALGAWR